MDDLPTAALPDMHSALVFTGAASDSGEMGIRAVLYRVPACTNLGRNRFRLDYGCLSRQIQNRIQGFAQQGGVRHFFVFSASPQLMSMDDGDGIRWAHGLDPSRNRPLSVLSAKGGCPHIDVLGGLHSALILSRIMTA